MDTELKIKNILWIAVIIGILAVAYAAVVYTGYYSKTTQNTAPSFSVTGEGKETVIPDIAQFTFSVISQGGKDIGSTQKENTDKTNRIINFLKSNSVEAKDIKTQGYNIDPRYQNFNCPVRFGVISSASQPCPPPEIVGYTVTQTVEVKIRDFAKIGAILSGTVQNGANSVSQLFFSVDDPEKVQAKAREQAIAKAQAKAEIIAQAAGFKIGKLLSIDESGPIPFFQQKTAFGLGGADTAPAVAPIIEPGTQEITVNVFLRYEIR